MAYSKQTWDTTSYVNPTRMNHIEDGIEGVEAEITTTSQDDVAFTNTKCDSAYQITCRRNGNVVSISTLIHNPNDAISTGEILTDAIPQKYRPTHGYAFGISTNGIIIQAFYDGTLGLPNISANIPAGWYYPVNFVYII